MSPPDPVAPGEPGEPGEAGAPTGGADERARSFALLREHPDLAGYLGGASPAPGARQGCRDLAGLAAVLVSVLALSLLCAAFLPQLALIPLVMAGVAVLAALGWLVQRPARRGPLERLPLRVLAVRASVASRAGGDGEHRCVAVLEDETGRTLELEATSDAAAELRPGSLGVAFRRGRTLESFVPLFFARPEG